MMVYRFDMGIALPMVSVYWGPVLLAAFYTVEAVLVAGARKPGAIVARYAPPESLSPAAVRYARINGADGKTIAAVLASLALKGLITLERSGDGFEIKRTAAAVPANLPHEEQVLMDLLFAFGDPNVITPGDNARMDGMVSGLEGALLKQYQGVFFTGNYNKVALGVLVSLVWALATAGASGQGMFAAMWGSCFTLVLFAVLWARALPAWKDALRARLRGRALAMAVFLMPLPLLMAGAGYFAMSRIMPADNARMVLLLAAINVVGASLLGAPTPRGRKVLDEIEGYCQFLLRVEQDPLDRLSDSTESSKLDANIPYAIALDIKEAWGDHLCGLFLAATVAKG